MNRHSLFACWLLSLAFTAIALGEEPTTKPVQPRSAQGQAWELQADYSDEFDGTALDDKKWDNDISDWGLWSWEPENVRVEDGKLKLKMQYKDHERNGKKLHYTSGAIRTRASPIKYGYFEARIKQAPLWPGVSPAFWMYHTEKDIWTEIDFELGQTPWVNLNSANDFVFRHPKLEGDKRYEGKKGAKISESQNWDMKCDPRKGFHVYGIEWDETEIKWYCDGKLVRTRQNEYWSQALDVIVSLGLRPPYATKPSPEGFPTEFEVDYVRVWKRPGTTSAPATQPSDVSAKRF